jgi:hypothetical protein
MKLISAMKSLDFLGPEIKFRINQQENFKTVFGGMISILYYIFFFSFFMLFGVDFFYKINPKILSRVLKDKSDNKTINLSNENFFFAFRVASQDSKTIELNLNPENIYLSHQLITLGHKDYTNITFLNCNNAKFNKEIINLDKKQEFLCADFSVIKDKAIGGHYDTIENFCALILFQININENLFKNLSGNDTKQGFKSLIKEGIYAEMHIAKPNFDPNNYTNPLNYDRKFITGMIFDESGIYYQAFLSDYVVETDNGVLLDGSVSTEIKTGFGRIERNFFKQFDKEFNASFTMEIFYEKAYFLWTRQYMKFQDLLGNINGFMEMTAFVFSFFISFNSDYRLNKYIANKLIYIVDADINEKINLNYRRDADVMSKKFNEENKNNNNKIDQNNQNIFVKVEKDYNKIDVKISKDLSKTERNDLIEDKSYTNNNNQNHNKKFLLENHSKKLNEDSLKILINFSNEIHNKKKTSQKVLEYSFLDHLFKSKICKYKYNFDNKKANREIAEEITEKALKRFDILFYLRLANEFEKIKSLILDEYQLKVLMDVSKRLYFYKHFINDEKLDHIKNKKSIKDYERLNKHFLEKYKKDELSRKDIKLFDLFEGLV